MDEGSLSARDRPSRLEASAWALEATTDCVVLLDRDFRLTYVNRRTQELNGFDPASVIGRTHWEVWPASKGSQVEERYRRALASGQPVHFAHRYLEPGVIDVWLEIHVYPSEDGLAIFLRDVSAQRRQVDEERESRERLARAIDATDLGVWRCELPIDASPFYWSPQVRRHFGIGLDEEIGVREFLELLHPDDREMTSAAMATAIRERVPYDVVYRTIGRDGKTRWVRATGNAFYRENGEPYRFDGFTIDLTDRMQEAAERMEYALERSRAEHEVRRLTDRYKALAETAASAVFTASADGAITEIPLLRGIDPELAHTGLGAGWLSAIHPADRPSAVEAWRRSIGTGQTYETEFRILMEDGHYRWHLTRGVPLADAEGRIVEWIGSCVDIHERVSRERTLRLLDEFTAATRDLKDPEEIMSLAQRMIGVRLGASRVIYAEARDDGRSFGGVPNYCVGCVDLNGRLPVSGFSSKVSEGLRAGQVLVMSDTRAAAEEDAGWQALREVGIAAAVCVPLLKEGRPIAMMGVHQTEPRDWSTDEVEMIRSFTERCWSEVERARTERELLSSEQRLRRILEAATVGVIVNDRPGIFLYANPPLRQMLGYTLEEIQAGEVSWSRIQAPDRIATDNLALEQLRLTSSCSPYETELVRKDGTRVPVYIGAAVVPDEGGAGQLGAAFVTDLSALKAAEHELRSLNVELDERVRQRTADLQAANEALMGFTYHVSHDLRAPLRAIMATSRMVQEDFGANLPPEANALLERQADSAKRLGNLIDDLLKLSRLSRQEIVKEPIDLSAMAEDAAVEARTGHPFSKVKIEIQPGVTAHADPRLLRLALLNLIENAVKYSPSGGTVRVGRDAQGRYLVSDEGIGMEPQYLHKIFEPFQRLHNDREFSGTGIGLANVRQVIERHGGSVWAESEPGRGSTFFFTLG